MKLETIAALLPEPGILEVHETIDSTNLRCKALAAQGAVAGTAVAADCQTAGRGRLGRRFESAADLGVYLSVLLRPDCAPMALQHLTAMAAVAVREAILETCGLETGIKWINDLVFGRRKLCGILVELGFDENGRVASAVVGVGVNCAHRQEDFPEELRQKAGSISMATGRTPDRDALCAAMIRNLRALQGDLFEKKQAYLTRYAEYCITLGQRVRIVGDGPERFAQAIGLDEDAGLIVRYDDGSEGIIRAGEVSVRGMYGYTD